jgi:cold shock CspA family protein
MSSSSNVSSSAPRTTGRVKWFNNKAGYGFITATTGVQAGTDVFAHHSGLAVTGQQYRYLVQGEYVEFQMNSVEGGAHRFQASDVTGIGRGMLMCETRRSFRETQGAEQESQSAPAPVVIASASDNNGGAASAAGGAKKTSARGSGPRAEVVDLTTQSTETKAETKTGPAIAPKRTRAPKTSSVAL